MILTDEDWRKGGKRKKKVMKKGKKYLLTYVFYIIKKTEMGPKILTLHL